MQKYFIVARNYTPKREIIMFDFPHGISFHHFLSWEISLTSINRQNKQPIVTESAEVGSGGNVQRTAGRVNTWG